MANFILHFNQSWRENTRGRFKSKKTKKNKKTKSQLCMENACDGQRYYIYYIVYTMYYILYTIYCTAHTFILSTLYDILYYTL